jgi:hypothetical protein
MRVAVLSANLGGGEGYAEHVEQSAPADFFRFTDENTPARRCAMTSRLQAKLPKLFGWQLQPGYDWYVWLDAPFSLARADSLQWLLDQCGDAEAAFFRHPQVENIRDETEMVCEELAAGSSYLCERYTGELLQEQLAVILADSGFTDDLAIAAGAFVYRDCPAVRAMMREWWYYLTRYCLEDQLSLPYALHVCRVRTQIIEHHFAGTPYLTYQRRPASSPPAAT